jgi:hypothetical protein
LVTQLCHTLKDLRPAWSSRKLTRKWSPWHYFCRLVTSFKSPSWRQELLKNNSGGEILPVHMPKAWGARWMLSRAAEKKTKWRNVTVVPRPPNWYSF